LEEARLLFHARQGCATRLTREWNEEFLCWSGAPLALDTPAFEGVFTQTSEW